LSRSDYVVQELSERILSGHFLLYDGDRPASGRGLRRPLNGTEECSVFCDPQRQRLALEGARTPAAFAEPLTCFATHLAVGELGLYFTVDLRVGRTLAFRVDHQNIAIVPAAAFDSDHEPRTCVCDRHALAATFCVARLTLWHIASGGAHRALAFDVLVTAVAFDPQNDSVIVAVAGALLFLSVNGEVPAKCAFDGCRVSCAAFMGNVRRGAFCGTTRGEIWCITPVYETGKIVIKELTSPHSTDGAEIRELVVHRLKGGMLIVDGRGRVCAWTGLGEANPPRLNPAVFKRCHACRRQPTTCCQRCGLGLCDGCSHERNPGNCPALEGAENGLKS
jgi:hypothetical protein